MKNKTWTVLILGFLAAVTTTASAADPGFYFTAGAGLAEEDPDPSDGINISIGIPPAGIIHLDPYRVAVDTGDIGWEIAAGYRFSRHFAAEIEYLDLGTTDITEYYNYPSMDPIIDILPFSYSSHISGPAVSLLASLPLGGDFEVYLRAGALFADREIQVNQYTEAGSTTFGDTVWLGGAGIDWAISSHWGIRAEYQLSSDFDATLLTGKTRTEFASLRLRYR